MTEDKDKVSRADAEKVLAAVKRRFKAWTEPGLGPHLVRKWDGGYGAVPYAIVWEEGPDNWTACASMGSCCKADWPDHPTPKIAVPPTVWLECYTSYALSIHAH
jgi:hypothetical protein